MSRARYPKGQFTGSCTMVINVASRKISEGLCLCSLSSLFSSITLFKEGNRAKTFSQENISEGHQPLLSAQEQFRHKEVYPVAVLSSIPVWSSGPTGDQAKCISETSAYKHKRRQLDQRQKHPTEETTCSQAVCSITSERNVHPNQDDVLRRI